MQKIARTPKPPYYAVIAPTVVGKDSAGYPEMAAKMIEFAQEVDGFLGIENCFQGHFVLSVSYWKTLEDIQEWRVSSHHMFAKENGKNRWFKEYFTRIAKVERDY